MENIVHLQEQLAAITKGLPAILLGGLAALLWLAVSLPLKKFCFRRLRRRWPREGRSCGSVVVNAASAFAVLLVAAVAVAIPSQAASLPAGVVQLLSWASIILITLAAAAAVDRLICGAASMLWRREEQSRAYRGIVAGVTHIAVGAAALILILDNAGVSITPLLTSLGIGSVAIALALQDTLANLFSGLSVLVDKPVAVGQFVEIEGGTQGQVDHVSWRSTRIRRLDDNVVVVPNTKIAGAVIVNYDMLRGELTLPVRFAVADENDLGRVESASLAAAREAVAAAGDAPPEGEPVFRICALTGEGVECQVLLRSRSFPEQYALRHEFLKRLHACLRREGIALAVPVRRILSVPQAS